jgi:hypothetical protein
LVLALPDDEKPDVIRSQLAAFDEGGKITLMTSLFKDIMPAALKDEESTAIIHQSLTELYQVLADDEKPDVIRSLLQGEMGQGIFLTLFKENITHQALPDGQKPDVIRSFWQEEMDKAFLQCILAAQKAAQNKIKIQSEVFIAAAL